MVKKFVKCLAFCSCLAFGLFNGDCWGMEKSESAPELREIQKIEIRPRSNSLPIAIIPAMKSEELSFKEIEYPKILDKYQGMREVEIIKERLLEIAKLGMRDPRKLCRLVGQIIANYDERDSLFVVIGDDISYIDAMISVIYERLLELGVWDAHFIASEFYTPCVEVSKIHASSMSYKGKYLSERILSIIGQYIEAVEWVKKDFLRSRSPFSDTFRSIIQEVKQGELPTKNYISWAVRKALIRVETQ